jgi:transcriptional regulator NrdR family protein
MKSNRNFLKRAQKEGVRIEKISHFTDTIHASIEQVNSHWIKTKKIGSLGFLLHLDP